MVNAVYLKYAALLKSVQSYYDFVSEDTSCSDCNAVSSCVTAPVIVSFVRWVIANARQQNINRLYFLSRDGYIMYRSALKILDGSSDIEVRYICCSRHSLRMAAYSFRNDEAYNRIFAKSAKLTAYDLLSRVDFNLSERISVYEDISDQFSVNELSEKVKLSVSKFSALCDALNNSVCFMTILDGKSNEAYDRTEIYFRQNGLLDDTAYAIVDTGWTGSIQFAMSGLIKRMGGKCNITGFYIGMLENPPKSVDENCCTWLFSGRGRIGIRSWFNQNLLECICSAPFGMTVGYTVNNGAAEPLYALQSYSNAAEETIKRQISAAEKLAERIGTVQYCPEKERMLCIRLLKMLMLYPLKQEGDVFSVFNFCDDVSESYHIPLVRSVSEKELEGFLLHNRIRRIITHENITAEAYHCQPLWLNGSLAVSNIRHKKLYRISDFLWKSLRYLLFMLRK